MDVSQGPEWQYTVVDVSDNSTTVYANPCLLKGVIVTTALSAHVCPIQDDTVAVATLPASAAAGTQIDCYGVKILTSLVVDPNDSGTGMITVIWKPNHDGIAGSGYSGADNGL